jgi:hypothetical protein
MLLTVLLLLPLIVFLLMNKTLKEKSLIILSLTQQNQNLLNRLQSPDLKTFLALQNQTVQGDSLSSDDQPYIRQDDEAEHERLEKLSGAHGLGDTVYDNEFNDALSELGISTGDVDRETT